MKKMNLENVADALANSVVNSMNIAMFDDREPIGYKKVKVPRYITIKIPMISRHYDHDSEYGTGELEGLLISLEEIISFKIGTKTVSEPIYKKVKGEKLNISRFTKL